MKKSMAVFIALAVLAAGGAAWAADTNTLTVRASVAPTCRFSTATSLLDFGLLIPAPASPDVPGSATTNFWCTAGVTETITAGNGLYYSGTSRQMMGPAGTFIPYSLTLTPSVGANVGPSAPRTLTLAGVILGADYRSASGGDYFDTVVLSITP